LALQKGSSLHSGVSLCHQFVTKTTAATTEHGVALASFLQRGRVDEMDSIGIIQHYRRHAVARNAIDRALLPAGARLWLISKVAIDDIVHYIWPTYAEQI
jgi:hypothetical protein